MYKFLCRHKFSILLDIYIYIYIYIYLEVVLLGHMITLCLTF